VRLATPLALVFAATGLLAGCGSADESNSTGPTGPAKSSGAPPGATTAHCALEAEGMVGLRATGVSCGKAQKVAIAWAGSEDCAGEPGASRTACTASGYRCLGTRTERGLSVSCSQPGRAIAFTVRPQSG
jgi:hypothetical protein